MDVPRVIYVDDEPSLLQLTKIFLEEGGDVQVDTELCSDAALARIAQGSYDAIVSDYQMPRMSGIELLKELRKRGDHTPFILFTGRGREEVAIEALNNGADFYLQKGGDPRVQYTELKNAIVQLAQRKKAERRVVQGEQHYRDLVEGANSIILKLDALGNIIFLNTFGMKFFECGTDILGKPAIGTLLRPQDHPELDMAELFAKFRSSRDNSAGYTFPVRRRGEEAWISWTMNVVRDGQGTFEEHLIIGNDVTAAKKAEMELQRSTSVLKAAMDSSDEGILVVSKDRTISDYNRRFLDLWQIPPSVMEGRSGDELADHLKGQLLEPDRFIQYVDECYASPDRDDRHILEFKDGRILELYSTPARVGKEVIGRYWSCKDITRLKNHEQEILESERNFKGLFENNLAIMLLMDCDSGDIIDANRAACHFYGYDHQEITQMKISQINTLPPGTVSERLRDAQNEHMHYFNFHHRLASGEVRDVEVFSGPITYGGRTVLFSIIHDVTEMKRVKRLLEEVEVRYDNVLNSIGEGIMMIDAQDRVVYANQRLVDIARCPLSDLIGAKPLAFVAPDSLELARANLSDRRNGSLNFADYKVMRGDGSELWALVTGKPVIQEGHYVGTIYAVTDISERKRMENELRKSEENFRVIFDNANDAIFITDREGHFLEVNDMACQRLGYSREELTRMSPQDIDDPEFVPLLPGRIKGVKSVRHDKFETVNITKSGQRIPTEVSAKVIRYNGRPAGLAIARDITEHKKTVEMLQRANGKLNLLSSITRHDILNQYTAIMAHIELARRLTSESPVLDRLQAIERSARAIRSHIDFTKDYAELGTQAPQWQNVAAIVRDLDIAKGIAHLVMTERAQRLEICADPMLRKVFHNLLENSVKYAARPTRVRLDCQMIDGHLRLSYEDVGPGVPADEKKKIFDKGHGKGTGFGLFLSREILAITGITIIESGRPEQGARFEMVIPPGYFRSLENP
jgi:PAS domain S-box-containing protein